MNQLPEGIRKNKEAVAEVIENNVRKLIIDESPINPKYYEKMSELLDALIKQRRQEALDYQEYLRKIVELTKKVKNPGTGAAYPATLNTPNDLCASPASVCVIIYTRVSTDKQTTGSQL